MTLRETIQVGDEVQTFDLALFAGEACKAVLGLPANVVIVSPWISNVGYFLGGSGLSIAVPNIPFGRSDGADLLQIIKTLMQNPHSSVKIATLHPDNEKYDDPIFQLWELRFLLEASETGAKILFYKGMPGSRKILHPKFLLTSLGVVFGSFNFTQAGRYSNIEDGNYASSASPVYFEKKRRVDEIISQCEEVDNKALQASYRQLSARIQR